MARSEKNEKTQVFYPGQEYWVVEKNKVHLVGSRCKKCGQSYFPPMVICPKCFAEGEMEKIKMSNRGKLYSYTIVFVAPKQFTTPYALGYVDFLEEVRVLGQLTTTDPEELKLDMNVQVELGRIRFDQQGNEVISYKFRPI
jgi:uncharacterized OB-fold protein